MKSNSRPLILGWLIACAACAILFRDAFSCWFLMDDFAWLGFKQEIASYPGGSGWKLLFEPRAQGTVRLFSERLYFWILSSLAGFDPLPFRLIAFGTQFLNLWLIARLAARLNAGSWLAGSAAAFFYSVSAHLALPLAWASAYNQILAACCMLAAFHWLLDWIETGKARYWWIQFAVFLLSFGVLEAVVVYPAIATLWTLLFARKRIVATLPLWLPSIAFAVWHLFWIPRPASPIYTPVYDEGLVASLIEYTRMALGPAALAVVFFASLAFVVIREKKWMPLFFCFWFLAFLAPVLPFQYRLSGYYLVLPCTGLALCIGTLARPSRFGMAILAVAAVAFTWTSAIDAQAQMDWLYTRSERIHRLFDAGAQMVKTKHVDTLLLSGVDTELFETALQDSPFRLLGLHKVYLVPGSETAVRARADLGGVGGYRMTLPQAVQALESGSAAVLSISGGEVFDATARYRGVALSQYLKTRPRSVNVGEPGYESLLGPGWWSIEDKFRWTSKTASLTLGGPTAANDRLHITGYCPPTVSQGGPVTLIARVNGAEIGRRVIGDSAAFSMVFALARAAGTETVKVEVEASRITRLPGDKRDLGLIFGTFAIRP